MEHRIFDDLSDETRLRCIEYVKVLGLQYSAIDLALDEDGKYWFLEVNPNGQWAFVELATVLQISKAIAELLSSGGGS